MTDISEPLRQLRHKDSKWQWNEVHENAFKDIKQAATEAPIFRYFNPSEKIKLKCDACETGLQATLLQEDQPLAYPSHLLTDTEHNYTQIKKGHLTIILGAEQFDQCTYGRKVVIKSDHKPLEVIYQKPLMAMPQKAPMYATLTTGIPRWNPFQTGLANVSSWCTHESTP